MAGGGVIVTPNGKGGLGSEGLVFGGARINTPIFEGSAGIVGFGSRGKVGASDSSAKLP